MNLLCADGLPGGEGVTVSEHLATLDRMAAHVRRETERYEHQFRNKPEDFKRSKAYFLVLTMITVLQQDFGCRYNPDRIRLPGTPFEPDEIFYRDSKDVFIHGLLGARRGGTCSSMPVFYAAIGRRLGYPIKLVTANGHLFVRWEDERERLNIEATNEGLNCYKDGWYRNWPFPMTGEEEEREGHLKALTPQRELQVFLSIRSMCLAVAGRLDEAIRYQQLCAALHPSSYGPRTLLAQFQRQASTSYFQANPAPETRMISMSEVPNDPRLRAQVMMFQAAGLRGADRSIEEGEVAFLRAEILSRQRRGELPPISVEPNPWFHPPTALMPVDPTPGQPRQSP